MKINSRKTFLTGINWLYLFAIYFLLLAWNGYSFGHGDTIELFPYSKWLINNELYPNDFFIQNISSSSVNERFVLAYFFSWFGEDWFEIVSLLLHATCSIFLLAGLYRIGKLFIRSEWLVWMAVVAPFFPFFSWNLGGNEMYIPLVSSSTVAKAFGIWAVYFFLKKEGGLRNDWFAFVLLSIATLVQPLVGLQLFLILGGVRVCIVFFERKIKFQNFLPLLFYVLTGGVWVIMLQKEFTSGTIDNQLLFEFFEFRLPHHFIPSSFSKRGAVLLLPLFVLSLFFYKKKNREVFLFFVIALLGCLIYVVGVEFLKSSTIVSSQWFKSTIWLKSFSFFALFAVLESRVPVLQKFFDGPLKKWVAQLLIFISVLIMIFPVSIFRKRDYDLPFFLLNKHAWEISISRIAKKNTPVDAQFIIPMSNTHFKHFSERSTYIDHKAVIHRKAIIPIWYERIQEIYGVNWETRQSGKDIAQVADENFRNLTVEELRRFSQKGIQYLLTYQGLDLPFEMVGENRKYVIYKLQ